MKIVIDFRMHRASGIGTYIRSLVPFLVDKFEVILLGNTDEISKYAWASKVKTIGCYAKIYSIKEQLELPIRIPKCDIFWSPHYNIPVLPIKAKKRLVTIHDVFHLVSLDSLSFKARAYATFMINKAVEKSDMIFTVSKFSSKEIAKYTKKTKEIEVVYSAVDTNYFKPVRDKSVLEKIRTKYNLPDEFLLFVGNIKPHKNLKSLILAIKNININLVIVGKREGFITKDNDIYEIIKKNGLENRVFFTGYVEDEDMPAIYSMAKLFVFPSTYEGFGLPPLEAQACGTPVVCSNTASLPEIYGDSVIYFNPYDADDIKEKIELVINNRDLQNKLRLRGFENVKRFIWEKSAKKLINILEDLYEKSSDT